MQLLKRRKQKTRKNRFRGETEGNFLVDFLTSETCRPSRETILQLLDGVRKVGSYAGRLKSGVFRIEGENREFNAEVVSLNERLSKYKVVFLPAVQHLGQNRYTFGQIYLRPERVFDPCTRLESMSGEELEHAAIQRIFALAKAGLIDRLRRCKHCDKWIYARFSNQGFCSPKCRISHWQQDEAYKAEKARKAKAAYYAKKARKEAQERRWLGTSKGGRYQVPTKHTNQSKGQRANVNL